MMKRKTSPRRVAAFVVLLLGALTMLLPFAWMISTSFKHANLVYTIPPQWIPNPVDWDNYSELWSASNVVTGLLNSTIISLTVLTLSTFTSTMAAFSFDGDIKVVAGCAKHPRFPAHDARWEVRHDVQTKNHVHAV